MQPNARKIAYSFGTSLLRPAGLTSASLQQWNRSHPFHKSQQQQQQQQQQLQSDTDSANHPNNFSFRDSISNIDETELEMIIDGAAAASTATSVAGGGGDGISSTGSSLSGTGGAEISSFPLQWTSNPVRDSHVTQDNTRDSVPTEMRVSQASYLRDSQLSYLSYPSIITRESSFVATNRPPYPQHQHHHSTSSPTKQ